MDFGELPALDYSALASAGVAVVVVALIALLADAAGRHGVLVCAGARRAERRDSRSPHCRRASPRRWHNVGAFLLYGLIYIGLAIVASIPFGLGGWSGPMIVGSCYAGWRTIFGR